jgi:hypothetical protein
MQVHRRQHIEDGICLLVQTNRWHLQAAEAARTQVLCNGQEISVRRRRLGERGFIAQELEFDQARGEPIVIEKIVALYTSRDHAISECSLEAGKAVRRAGRFEDLLQSHGLAWEGLWSQCDITLEEKQGTQLLLRLHMFHQFEGYEALEEFEIPGGTQSLARRDRATLPSGGRPLASQSTLSMAFSGALAWVGPPEHKAGTVIRGAYRCFLRLKESSELDHPPAARRRQAIVQSLARDAGRGP